MAEFQCRFDPNEFLSEKIIIDKLDAACRQLESAITMFFHEWDVVSQHTLISAAHGILQDLAIQRGLQGGIKDSPLIRPEKRKKFINAINLAQNFFKHADQDGGTKLVFRYNVSHFYLFDAVRFFVLLHGSPTSKMIVFLMWLQLRYPDLFCFLPEEEGLQEIREGATRPEAFKVLARKLLEEADGGLHA